MKLRIKPLLFILLLPALVASAGSSLPPAAGGPVQPALYPSQADSRPPPLRYAAPPAPNAAARLAYWSELAWRTIAIDHAPPPAGPAAYIEQAGPTRSSRVRDRPYRHSRRADRDLPALSRLQRPPAGVC
jgi:hypothetical protein